MKFPPSPSHIRTPQNGAEICGKGQKEAEANEAVPAYATSHCESAYMTALRRQAGPQS